MNNNTGTCNSNCKMPSCVVQPDKVGVCSWSYRLPMREVVAQMEKDGIRNVNLALIPFIDNDKYHGGSESQETFEWIKEKVKSGAINVCSTMISTVGEDYSTIEAIKKTGGIVPDEHWEANKARFSQGAKLTQELGCSYLLSHAGFLDHNDAAAYAKYLERVTWIRDELAKYGVSLIMETGQETAEDLERFLPAVPGVYVNFDPGNMLLYGKGRPLDAVKKLAPWIKQIHAKDAIASGQEGVWGTEMPWGEGQVQAREMILTLNGLGFDGCYVIEREKGDTRAADIALAAKRLKELGH